VFAHVALHEQPRFRLIDAGRQQHHRKFERLASQDVGFLRQRQRVHVDEAEDVVGLVLPGDPVFDGAEVVADVNRAGGLNAGKNDGARHIRQLSP